NRRFGLLERISMETFAAQAAQALDRAEVYAREVIGRRQLEGLGGLAASLSSAMTTEDVARVVVERGMSTTSADTCTLYALDERAQVLELIGERGVDPAVVGQVRRISEGSGNPMYAAMSRGESVWVETPAQYEAFFPALARARSSAMRAQSFWGVPLIA